MSDREVYAATPTSVELRHLRGVPKPPTVPLLAVLLLEGYLG